MDEYLRRFFDEGTTASNYPPYNIVHVNNVESKLEIALAGFKKKEVKVYTEYGKLVVEGNKEEKRMLITHIKVLLKDLLAEHSTFLTILKLEM